MPRYKYCIVPMCKNSTVTTRGKYFFSVPRFPDVRKKWCSIMKRDGKKYPPLSWKSSRHVCQDHFNVEEDTENLLRYRLIGGNLKLKKGVLPHIFLCQKSGYSTTTTSTGTAERAAKRQRRKIISELIESYDNKRSPMDITNNSVDENTTCNKPLGSKKRKKAAITKKNAEFDSIYIKPEPPDDEVYHSNPPSEGSSNSNQGVDVPRLTLNWTPSIFKEEPPDYSGTAESPEKDSKAFVLQSYEEETSDDGDFVTGVAESPERDPSTIEGMENAEHGVSSSDSKRARRSIKKTMDSTGCPVCGVTLREPDLEPHYSQEVERLSSIPKKYKKFKNENGISDSFVQVKCNRENRVRAKFTRYLESAPKKTQCPICKERISGSESEINDHVVCCAESDTHVNVEDDDYESSYEELEIGNETRIRTASLVRGGYRTLFGPSCVLRNEDDSDTDIVVDVDDTNEFGSPQYTELDVISDSNHDDEKKELLRRSVISDPDTKPNVIASRKWSDTSDIEDSFEESVAELESEETKNDEPVSIKNECDMSENRSDHSNTIIHSLKQRIKSLEKQNKSTITCLICLEPYSTPLVSTTCWHVHCEECWLKNMGEKKLCPQCNMIVCPSNLRKIYL